MKHLFLLSSFLLLHFLACSQAKIYNTWVGQDNEYFNIFNKTATLQKGSEYEKFDVIKYVKNKYFVLSGTNHDVEFTVKYNIVRLTQDTLILSPEGEDLFNLAELNSQNQYVFVNSMLTYKFVKLHYEASYSNEYAVISRITLDIDSAKKSKVTVKDDRSNTPKVYKSPLTKEDYERLIKILSSYDLSFYPNEIIEVDSICQIAILEIQFNDQKKLFKRCNAVIPKYYSKLGDFMLEYISLRSGIDFMRLGKAKR